MHAALRRGAAQGRARADGPRFLVIWARAQPQGVGDIPAPSSCAGTVRAAAHAGGAVSFLDTRELHNLIVRISIVRVGTAFRSFPRAERVGREGLGSSVSHRRAPLVPPFSAPLREEGVKTPSRP